jgi:hypothetical protein
MPKRVSVFSVGAIVAVAIAVAGCGGGGSKSSSSTNGNTSTTSTKPSGINHDPAQAILAQLGLKECSSKNIPSTALVNPNSSAGAGSFAGARIFEAAPDCSKGPKTTIVAATFSTHEGIAAGKAAIKKKYPKAGVASFRTVVVGVLGPNAQATADKIVKLLSAGVVKS